MKGKHSQVEDGDRAEQTRKKILRAAVDQFSQRGLAGARTDAIAGAAKVNKALLYYYFKSKSGLYAAALEDAASKIAESSISALESGVSAGESLLRLALHHFDRVSSQRGFQSLMQQEMVRFHRGESEIIPMLARSLYRPLLKRMQATIQEGIRTGELCEFDWLQVIYSAFGANIFYFLSAPIMRIALPVEPTDRLAPEIRRKAALELLGQTLFRDRNHGLKLAQEVLASSPAPKVKQSAQKFRAIPMRRCP
jgi:TetR/AcrR family transcriptional regulator